MKVFLSSFLGVMVAFSGISTTANAADSLYWGNQYGGPTAGQFRVGNLDGSGTPSAIMSFQPSPCGIAIDAASGKIYFGNFGSPGIQVANLATPTVTTTLFSGQDSICGIAIDPKKGKIYWSTVFGDSIKVGNLDGSGLPSVLFTEASSSWPTGVTLDTAGGKIYWTNQHSNEVRVGSLTGGVGTTLVSGEPNPIGVVINPSTKKLYWANYVENISDNFCE